jgi:hypothetical protein
MIKARKAMALVYGRSPELKVYPIEARDQTGITLVTSYLADSLYDDAIVWVDVTDA